ncbi:MAG: branched-chain amino acid ABC transporter permease [Nitrospirae bacterium]|nr:branched-chain amino acid ABC transporter permease [Nitrospirota bacterium]
MGNKKYIQTIGFAAAVVSIQIITYFSATGYFLTQLTMSGYYSIVVIGLCLLMGYAGQISIGHAGFFAMGGYITAVLTTFNFSPFVKNTLISLFSKTGILIARQDLYGGQILSFHPLFACAGAVIFTIVVAYIIGGPVLKLKGHYLAMATLGLGTIIYKIVIGTTILGEADGISDVPAFTLIPGLLEVSGKPSMRIQNYYFAWGLVIISMVFVLNLIDSRVGRALRSIHGAEDASNAMGVDTAKYKLHTFVLSAALAAMAGVFLTHFNGGIGPSEASIMKSVRYVAIVAVGGMANLWGALIMGALLNFFSMRGYFGTLDDAVFGGILILIMLFAPEGLLKTELFKVKRKNFQSAEKSGEV